jgi:hypothetical protein
MRVTIMGMGEDGIDEYISSLVGSDFEIIDLGRYQGNFVVETTEEYFLLLRIKYGTLSVWSV